MNILPRSICIIRLSAIGDICNAIAAVQAIQRQDPSIKITWITGRLEATLLKHIDDIEVIAFDKKGGIDSYLTLKKKLKHRTFDVLLHMQAALRASMLSLLVKSPRKIGFDRERAKDLQWLFTNEQIEKTNAPHVLDGFMAFAKKIGVTDLTRKWNINIPKEAKRKALKIISKKPTFLICPATSKVYKNWTTKGYCQLANHAIEKGYQVFICGAPTAFEKELAQKIIDSTNNQALDLVGKTNLIELVSLIKEADILLAPDTGATHIATMVNTPVIGLYAHHNPKRTGPYLQQDNVVSVYEKLILKETGKALESLAWRTRVKDNDAMQEISVNAVIEVFDRLTKGHKE